MKQRKQRERKGRKQHLLEWSGTHLRHKNWFKVRFIQIWMPRPGHLLCFSTLIDLNLEGLGGLQVLFKIWVTVVENTQISVINSLYSLTSLTYFRRKNMSSSLYLKSLCKYRFPEASAKSWLLSSHGSFLTGSLRHSEFMGSCTSSNFITWASSISASFWKFQCCFSNLWPMTVSGKSSWKFFLISWTLFKKFTRAIHCL